MRTSSSDSKLAVALVTIVFMTMALKKNGATTTFLQVDDWFALTSLIKCHSTLDIRMVNKLVPIVTARTFSNNVNFITT